MHFLLVALVTPWCSVQDKSDWDKPTAVVDAKLVIIPWHIYEGKHGALVVTLRKKERDVFQLVQYEERNEGWKMGW